jgi:hypothetical protein
LLKVNNIVIISSNKYFLYQVLEVDARATTFKITPLAEYYYHKWKYVNVKHFKEYQVTSLTTEIKLFTGQIEDDMYFEGVEVNSGIEVLNGISN